MSVSTPIGGFSSQFKARPTRKVSGQPAQAPQFSGKAGASGQAAPKSRSNSILGIACGVCCALPLVLGGLVAWGAIKLVKGAIFDLPKRLIGKVTGAAA